MFSSTKIFKGFSTVFRQWKAEGTHCKYNHGYGVSFKVLFEGEPDEKNWVWDFGGMKRAKSKIDGMNPKEWMDYMFDHTTIIASDDPQIDWFIEAEKRGILQLRVIQDTGAERFAEFICGKLDNFVVEETNGRVRVKAVEFMENENNSATYFNNSILFNEFFKS